MGEVDSVNFEQVMEAKEAYVRDVRNASQTLGPVAAPLVSRVLEEDVRCGSARWDYAFTDISKDFTNDSRRIFVREKTGVLRTASQEERDRSNQELFAGKNEKAWLPIVYKEQHTFMTALDQFTHAYLLDEICRIRKANSADYVRVHKWAYNHIAEMGIFQVLQDTPHFQGFARWLVAEDMIGRLIVPLLKEARVNDAAELVAVYCEERSASQPQVVDIEAFVVNELRQRMPKQEAYVPTASSDTTEWKSLDGVVTVQLPVPFKCLNEFGNPIKIEALRRAALELASADGGSVEVELVEQGGTQFLTVSGHPKVVQAASDLVYRTTCSDVLPQLYLKAYSVCQGYSDMRQLVTDAMTRAGLTEHLSKK
jgi:hypothetical protein